ncbi:hypothetical protein Tco_0671385, partial [Tanacetum coccineum]
RRDDECDNRLPPRRSTSSKSISKESPTSMEAPRGKPEVELRQKAGFQKSTQIEQKAG